MATYDEAVERLLSFSGPELGRGATQAQIEEAEQALGVPLAGGYRRFLEQFGWGGVESIELYGLGPGVPDHLNLVSITMSEREQMQPRLRFGLIPIMNDGGGNLYCIDTKAPDEPRVIFWDHGASPNQNESPDAEDFASWLSEQLDDL